MHDWYQSSTSTVNACIGASGSDGVSSGTGTEAIPAWRRGGGVVRDMRATGGPRIPPGRAMSRPALRLRTKSSPNDQPRARPDLAGRGATPDRTTFSDPHGPAVRSVGGRPPQWENHPMSSRPWTLVT